MSLTPGVGSFKTQLNIAYRFIDGYPSFIGASAGLSFTAAVPTHQAHDMIVVFAVNTSGGGIPVAPANEGWISCYTRSDTATGYHIAYKYAKSSNEAVGNWLPADRIIAAVYRNARAPVGVATNSAQASASVISYPAPDAPVIGSGGTRLLRFGFSDASNDAGNTPAGHATRISTASVSGASAPSLALHDLEVDPASTYPVIAANLGVISDTLGITLGIGFGTPPIAVENTSFSTTLNGDALARTVQVGRKGYRAELGQVFVTYASLFTCSAGAFTHSGADLSFARGYYMPGDTSTYNYSLTESYLQRALQLLVQTDSLTLTGASVELPNGFFTTPGSASFTTTLNDGQITHAAVIKGDRLNFDVSEEEIALQRAIIESFTGSSFSFSLSQLGIANNTLSPPAGGPVRDPATEYGGSDPSGPNFLRPQFVKYNSVSKSRDLGSVDNFFGTFSGEIGSQVGSPTLFFKIHVLGDAVLRINKNITNQYTDKQIAVGILDSDRKPVQTDVRGFARTNDNLVTEQNESDDPLPGGTYYFTVSSSQWQKIPYSVSIQAIRFKGIEGAALLKMLPTSRFAIAKLIGPALLSNGTRGTIPINDIVKKPTGQALLSSSTQGSLVIPAGKATLRNATTGRLKETHKISAAATLSGENVATLSSQPSGGGY